ncbi:unnamed protein product [Prorocentrum cordatum]|uniref:Fe2OG dioxygenase domain-containing protein n=1 Tax=Prorocentrum cordatum TaxID=2364126 RepID=A0ABN9YHX0_9DINO|nr:unnamed protein product [Polarella glacialis]
MRGKLATPNDEWGGWPSERWQDPPIVFSSQEVCIASGKRAGPSDFSHCPTPQSYVRCGPHHRAELCVLGKEDISQLHDIWWRYKDDLTWPWYEKKPQFDDADFDAFREIAEKVKDAMVQEFGEPMVLDQATISNTNHIGHPPHADNVQFDSVWWEGKRIRSEDEVIAAREGAYVLWRPEKTSYRSYSCTVSLTDPSNFEGGEVQFFKQWGDSEPVASYKCAEGCGVAFCGCQRNIHAVTGVRSGFRLVLLVWTRPPHVRVPDSQIHVCYFRPGTGLGVWLTTADVQQREAARSGNGRAWVPVEEDHGCQCSRCAAERRKVAWADCVASKDDSRRLAQDPATPTTSAGSSPRPSGSPSPAEGAAAEAREGRAPAAACRVHARAGLRGVVSEADAEQLYRIWQAYQDDLSHPWYEDKPTFTDREFKTFRAIAQKVVRAMSEAFGEDLVLDQATVSRTTHHGHPPHADNVQFDSVWWGGRQIKQVDELTAARAGAKVLWKQSKTLYRNYSATVSLCDPSGYDGGDLEFYGSWGEREPLEKHRPALGDGVAFCGCQRNIHAVTGVRWGFRLVLLVWTRSPDSVVPEDRLGATCEPYPYPPTISEGEGGAGVGLACGPLTETGGASGWALAGVALLAHGWRDL